MDANAQGVFAAETNVMSNLKLYATAYDNYQECNSSDAKIVSAITARFLENGGTYNCASTPADLNTATTNALNSIAGMETAIKFYKDSVPSLKKNNAQFDASMVQLKGDYASMAALRANLDLKLRNLYNAENSIADMNRVETDAAIYANILWTILATSMLYVVFTKL